MTYFSLVRTQVANALEAVAGTKTRSGQSAHSLALRLVSIQLLQLGISSETKRLSPQVDAPAAPLPTLDPAEADSQPEAATVAAAQSPGAPHDAANKGGLATSGSGLQSSTAADSEACSTGAAPFPNSHHPPTSSVASAGPGDKSRTLIQRLKSRERAITGHAVFNASALSRSGTHPRMHFSVCWMFQLKPWLLVLWSRIYLSSY